LAAVEVLLRNRDDRTDGDLLRDFLESKSEGAFAVIVRRHGPMVWGVCQRILGNADDADDAVQATFLVLATKANSLKARPALGDWLHGIARRTALNARRSAARRREIEMQIVRPAGRVDNDVADILPILDEELARLPEKYRLPIILCDLEGRTRKTAARQLRWPEGTVAGRLAEGRQQLAQRLTKRGVSLTASALVAAITAKTAAASDLIATMQVAAAAVQFIATGSFAGSSVVSAKVLALTQGVLKTMLLSKLKAATAIAIVSLGLAWGAGLVVHEPVVAQAKQAEKGLPKKGDAAKASSAAAREGKPPVEPLAHFRFDGDAKNEGKGEAEFDLQNTEFKENALYLNGKHEHFRLNGKIVPNFGFRAICTTPKMNYESFAVALRFKAESFEGQKINLFTGGRTHRWFGMERSPHGNLVVTLNNGRFIHEIKGAALEAGKWTVVACSVDVPGRKVIAYLNEKKVADVDLPKDFEIDVAKSEKKDSDKRWSFTNYSKAYMFHGLADELLIYGRSLSIEELGKVPLRP
jgi:RNA polymerase sigma factor (sigma-70 family)